jgi:DNA-binding transcriptional regulator LsrR (DeoR family)
VKTPLDDRVIGISLEELAKVDRVIGLAGGKSKTEAIAGALRTGVLSVLITDKFTAERLLEEPIEVQEQEEQAYETV